MELKINVPDYDRISGLRDEWAEGYEISVSFANDEVMIFANREGLISIATQLLALAQDNVPSGYHLHFSQDYGLEERSADLIIGKK